MTQNLWIKTFNKSLTKEKLQWKVHTTDLLKTILDNNDTASLRVPINIFQSILAEVAKRAIELNDLKLNALMMRLTLYSVSNPCEPDYNEKIVEDTIKKAQEVQRSETP